MHKKQTCSCGREDDAKSRAAGGKFCDRDSFFADMKKVNIKKKQHR